MTFTLQIYSGSAWTDISDYVIDSLSIPIIKRNKDFTISAEGFFLYLSKNIDEDLVKDSSEVKFYVDGYMKFHGSIRKKYYNKTYYRHELTIYDIIIKLQDYKIEYDVLHSYLTSREYIDFAVDSEHYTEAEREDFYSIPYLIETMFEIAGLEINTDDLRNSNEILGFNKVTDSYGTIPSFRVYDLYIGENMLYCINQTYACSHTKIESNDVAGYNFQDNKITFFDFISFICAVCKLQFHYKRVVNVGAPDEDIIALSTGLPLGDYNPESDFIFSQSEEVSDAVSVDYKTTLMGAATDAYKTTTASQIYALYNRNGEGEYLNWYSNLIILFRYADHYYNGYQQIYPYSVGNILYPSDLTSFEKINALIYKGAFTEYETEVKLDDKFVVENTIVLTSDARVSKIIQGNYNFYGFLT